MPNTPNIGASNSTESERDIDFVLPEGMDTFEDQLGANIKLGNELGEASDHLGVSESGGVHLGNAVSSVSSSSPTQPIFSGVAMVDSGLLTSEATQSLSHGSDDEVLASGAVHEFLDSAIRLDSTP